MRKRVINKIIIKIVIYNYSNSNEAIITTIIRNYYKFSEKRGVYNFVYI